MNVASLELVSEQLLLFRLTLIHGFQMFAIPAANKLPETHHLHKVTSIDDSIFFIVVKVSVMTQKNSYAFSVQIKCGGLNPY